MKAHKITITILSISICILGVVVFAYVNNYVQIYMPNSTKSTVTVSVSSEISTTQLDISEYLPNHKIIEVWAYNEMIPVSTSLDVPFVDQNPQLPTGCEITSLTEVLNYYGFDVDKEYMASNYLPMSEIARDGCYINYYLGSPWKDDGSGCFAPTIVNAANKFFEDNNSDLTATNVSYSEVNELFEYVASGYPVIVWTSSDYEVEEIKYTQVIYSTGGSFYWPSSEHCVVLSGYDIDSRTVTFADPTNGIVTHSIEEFQYYYEKFFYQAVVIR